MQTCKMAGSKAKIFYELLDPLIHIFLALTFDIIQSVIQKQCLTIAYHCITIHIIIDTFFDYEKGYTGDGFKCKEPDFQVTPEYNPDGTELEQGKIIATIPKMGRSYRMCVETKPTSTLSSDWLSNGWYKKRTSIITLMTNTTPGKDQK